MRADVPVYTLDCRRIGRATYALEQHARHVGGGGWHGDVYAVRISAEPAGNNDSCLPALWDIALDGEKGTLVNVKIRKDGPL